MNLNDKKRLRRMEVVTERRPSGISPPNARIDDGPSFASSSVHPSVRMCDCKPTFARSVVHAAAAAAVSVEWAFGRQQRPSIIAPSLSSLSSAPTSVSVV